MKRLPPKAQYAVAVIVPVVLVTGLVQHYGSCRHLIAALDGRLLVVNSTRVLNTPDSEVGLAQLSLENISSGDVRIVGFRSSCRCFATSNLPLTIHPGDRSSVRFQIKGASPSSLEETVTLFTVPSGAPVRAYFRTPD